MRTLIVRNHERDVIRIEKVPDRDADRIAMEYMAEDGVGSVDSLPSVDIYEHTGNGRYH